MGHYYESAPELKEANKDWLTLGEILMMAQSEGPDFVIGGYKEADTTGCLFGPYSSGKSLIALDEALKISQGMPVHGRTVKQGPVVYILGEGLGGFGRRVLSWSIANNVSDIASAQFLPSKRAHRLIDDGAALRCSDYIKEFSDANWEGQPPVAIFLDTYARNFGGQDENNTSEAQRWIDNVEKYLREPFGACVTVLHHPGHLEKHRMRGAYALPAAMDWSYEVKRDDDVVTVTNSKEPKDHAPPEDMIYRLQMVPVQLDNGRRFDGFVAREADASATTHAASHEDARPVMGQRMRQVINCTKHLYKQYSNNVEANGQGQARVTIEDVWEAMKSLGMTRAHFTHTLDRLQKARQLAVEPPFVFLTQ